MQAALIASALSFTSVAAAAVLSLLGAEPPRSNALVELQTGPFVLELLAPDAPARASADRACWSTGCPLIEMRMASTAAQGAEEEAGRVQRIAPAAFEDGGFAVEVRSDHLGEQRRMGEAARAQPAKNGEPGLDRLPPV